MYSNEAYFHALSAFSIVVESILFQISNIVVTQKLTSNDLLCDYFTETLLCLIN